MEVGDCCSEHGTTITAGGAGSKNISLSAQAGASGCFKYNDTGQTTTAEEWPFPIQLGAGTAPVGVFKVVARPGGMTSANFVLEGDGRLLFKYIHTDGVCWEGDLLNATKNVPVVFSESV